MPLISQGLRKILRKIPRTLNLAIHLQYTLDNGYKLIFLKVVCCEKYKSLTIFRLYILDLSIVWQCTSFITFILCRVNVIPDSVLLALTIVYGKPMFCYLLHTAFPPSDSVDPWEIISQQL